MGRADVEHRAGQSLNARYFSSALESLPDVKMKISREQHLGTTPNVGGFTGLVAISNPY